jgi:hypothetical protein
MERAIMTCISESAIYSRVPPPKEPPMEDPEPDSPIPPVEEPDYPTDPGPAEDPQEQPVEDRGALA